MKSFILLPLLLFGFVFGGEKRDPNEFCFSCSERRNHKDLYADPDDCHNYYQCFYANEKSAVGVLRKCQLGTFWHDRVLQCLPEDPRTPCNDICNNHDTAPKGGCYADPSHNCASYFVCANTASYHFCCPNLTRFDANNCTCVEDTTCQSPCTLSAPLQATTMEPPLILSDNQCRDSFNNTLALIEGRPDVFIAMGQEGNYTLACPYGTEFDLTACRCDRISEIVTTTAASPFHQCNLYLPFDDNIRDLSMSHFETFGYGNYTIDTAKSARGAGSLFVNNGRIEIPGMKTHDFQKAGSWCLFFRCGDGCNKTGGLLSAGRNNTIIASTPEGSFQIQVGLTGKISLVSERQLWNRSKLSSEGFFQVCIVYDNNYVTIYRNGQLQGMTVANGNIRIAHCPYLVGSDQLFGNFTGHIDEVLVCDFAMKQDDVTAHLAGQIALINEGLIPPSLGEVTTPYTDIEPKASPFGACGHSKHWNVGEKMANQLLKITGGVLAQVNEFPWQVHLSNGCGGTVMNENWVSTAGHCCKNAMKANTTITAYFGTNVKFSGTVRNISKIVLHENFSSEAFSHDICLLKISEPVKFDSWAIQPACLPTSCDDKSLCAVDEKILISGYGTLATGSKGNIKLRKAFLPLVSNEVCAERYNVTADVLAGMVAFCAGYMGRGGVDTCQGDSGGPVVCYKSGFFTLQGVVSFGEGCGEARYPGMYCNVCKVLPWIKSHMNND